MELYDAGIGDVITIPTHHPSEIVVTGYAWADTRASGEYTHLSWQGTGRWADWNGTTLLSDAAAVGLLAKAGPDNPLRRKYEADIEASLLALENAEG